MKTAIVTTTINKPEFLPSYFENLKRYDKTADFIIIGDKKSPLESKEITRIYADKAQRKAEYLDVSDQLLFMKNCLDLSVHIPFNSIDRRNIGILKAYIDGYDIIITIDDDNFPVDCDFVSSHSIVGNVCEFMLVESDIGWYNVCELLKEGRDIPFYPRGYPLEERWKADIVSKKRSTGRAVVNAGLWLGDPDIDSWTRLAFPIDVKGMVLPENLPLALGIGTWCPINSQNTAIYRDAVPAYFLSPHVGRYDDIWAGYVLKKIIDHMKDYVLFGNPLVRQDRNAHNLLVDFEKEKDGAEYTFCLVDILRKISLSSNDYTYCFLELAEKMASEIQSSNKYPEKQREYMLRVVEGMFAWGRVFSKL